MSRFVVATAVVLLCTIAIDRSAGADKMQLVVDGQPRTYLLERPSTPGPSPTIITLHGANGTAERIAQQTGLGRVGPDNGFAAVFPQARANVWNRNFPGHESPETIEYFRQYGGTPNDIGFLKQLIADLVQRGISDPKRIYLVGVSNGGFMTLSMFCFEGGLFAGLGLIVTSMIEKTGEDCRPAKPIPVLMVNGTADEIVLFAGGPVGPHDHPSPYNLWSRDRLMAFFRHFNDCLQPVETAAVPGQFAHKIEVDRSTNCYFGSVIAYRVIAGMHGSTQTDLDVGKLLVDFFRDNKPK